MNKARKFCMNQYIWYICILPFLLTACDRRELTYYETAEVTLTADWSQSGLKLKTITEPPLFFILKPAENLK